MNNQSTALETLSDDYILDVLDYILPRYTKQLISHSILAQSEIAKRELARRGATLVNYPDSSIKDEAGWYIIHWPSVMRWLFTTPQGHHCLTQHGYGYLRNSCTEGTDSFQMQWSRWKSHLESKILPPGSVNWSDDSAFRKILDVFPPDEVDPYYCTVFRAGPFLTWIHDKTFRDLASRFKVFHQLHDLSQAVYDRLPALLQVLITALRRAKLSEFGSPQKGFTDWGLAWTRHGLFFHYSRALSTLQRPQSITYDMFPDDRLLAYCANWLSPDYYTQRIRLPGITPLSHISEAPHNNAKLLAEGIEPFYALYSNFESRRRADPSLWDSQHSRFFPLTGKSKDNLFTFLETCLDLSRHPEKIEALSRRKKDPVSAARKALYYGKRVRNTVRFSISGSELSQFHDIVDPSGPPETLSMELYEYDGIYYMTAPLEVQLDFPALFTKAHFNRSNESAMTKYKLPNGTLLPLDITRHSFEKPSTVATLAFNDTLFFHPELLKPAGEVDSFIDFLLRNEGHRDKRSIARLKWFKQFMVWLEEPEQFLDDNPKMIMGEELRHLVDPGSPCPVKLKTRKERLEFFWAKGERVQHKELCWMPPQGKNGDRPPRLSAYDRWALWMGAQELTKLMVNLTPAMPDAIPTRVRLTTKQQAEFLCYRWLPWRTPASLLEYLVTPNYAKYEEKQRLAELGADWDMKTLALEKMNEWGVSYSQLRF